MFTLSFSERFRARRSTPRLTISEPLDSLSKDHPRPYLLGGVRLELTKEATEGCFLECNGMRSRVSEGGHGNGMKWCPFVRSGVRHTARISLILPNYTTLTSLPHYTALRHVITTSPYRSFRITSSYDPFCAIPPHHPFQITPIHCPFCPTNYHRIYLATPTKQPRRNALTHPIVKPRLTVPTISHCTIMSHHVDTFHHIIYNEMLYITH